MAHEEDHRRSRAVQDVLLDASLETVLDALAEWHDAKAEYHAADPEWRSSRDVDATRTRLKEALRYLLS